VKLTELAEIEEKARRSNGLGLEDCYKLIDEIKNAWSATPKKNYGYALAKNKDGGMKRKTNWLLLSIQEAKNQVASWSEAQKVAMRVGAAVDRNEEASIVRGVGGK